VSTSFNMNELRKSVPVNTYGKYIFAGCTPSECFCRSSWRPTWHHHHAHRPRYAPAQLATNLVDVTRYNYSLTRFSSAATPDDVVSIAGGLGAHVQYYVSANYQEPGHHADFNALQPARVGRPALTDWGQGVGGG
jgi:hypothetical protein